MDFVKLLAELVAERDKIDDAIMAIRNLDNTASGDGTGPRKRGRPNGTRNRLEAHEEPAAQEALVEESAP